MKEIPRKTNTKDEGNVLLKKQGMAMRRMSIPYINADKRYNSANTGHAENFTIFEIGKQVRNKGERPERWKRQKKAIISV